MQHSESEFCNTILRNIKMGKTTFFAKAMFLRILILDHLVGKSHSFQALGLGYHVFLTFLEYIATSLKSLDQLATSLYHKLLQEPPEIT